MFHLSPLLFFFADIVSLRNIQANRDNFLKEFNRCYKLINDARPNELLSNFIWEDESAVDDLPGHYSIDVVLMPHQVLLLSDLLEEKLVDAYEPNNLKKLSTQELKYDPIPPPPPFFFDPLKKVCSLFRDLCVLEPDLQTHIQGDQDSIPVVSLDFPPIVPNVPFCLRRSFGPPIRIREKLKSF